MIPTTEASRQPMRYSFPVPGRTLRNMIDYLIASGKKFTRDEATIDVMLSLYQEERRTIRYWADRWKWSKSTVHKHLPQMTADATGYLRGF